MHRATREDGEPQPNQFRRALESRIGETPPRILSRETFPRGRAFPSRVTR